MSGAHARPELLASPDWLAAKLGRSGGPALDVRWRPDGTGRLAFAAGHVPNATYLDWREAFVDPEDSDTLLLLAPPDQVTAAVAGAGIGNGSTVVVYDDTASLYAARTWWSLRAYGLESVRILDGGYGAWLASGRPISHAVHQPGPAAFAPRARRVARRADPGCPATRRVPRIPGERPAPRPRAGCRQPARRPHDRAGQRPLRGRRHAASDHRSGGRGRPARGLLRLV